MTTADEPLSAGRGLACGSCLSFQLPRHRVVSKSGEVCVAKALPQRNMVAGNHLTFKSIFSEIGIIDSRSLA